MTDHVGHSTSGMTALQMIAEWRRGCSNADSDNPWQCHVCTRALVDAIELVLQPVAPPAVADEEPEHSSIVPDPDYEARCRRAAEERAARDSDPPPLDTEVLP